MAFNPGGTDYRGYQSSRDRSDEGLTRALENKARADKQARIKKSGQRSGLQKLISAGVRGAAAYYSGGLSETLGGGKMIDSAMLGTDSEGNAVQNEYGDLAALGSAVYQGSKAQKAQKLAGADSAFDKQYAKRQANVDRLFEHADTAEAKDQAFKAQQSLDAYEQDYLAKKQKVSESGFLGTNLGVKDSDYTSLTAGMSPEELSQARTKRENELSSQVLKGKQEAEKRQEDQIRLNWQEGARGKGYKPSEEAPSYKAPEVTPLQDQNRMQQMQVPQADPYLQNQMMQQRMKKAEDEERKKQDFLELQRKKQEMGVS
jgi:hypothetical protein